MVMFAGTWRRVDKCQPAWSTRRMAWAAGATVVQIFVFSSRRRHTRWPRDWSSDVCSSDLSPNAVQQLDHRVDLFSLGYMAEKIAAVGLDLPPGPRDAAVLDDVRGLVQSLKGAESAPSFGPLP